MAGSRTHWFFDAELSQETTQLPKKELTRAKALRLRVGERITITDGRGQRAECEVALVERDAILIKQINILNSACSTTPWLIQAMTKHDPIEDALRLAIEFGAKKFSPWFAERSIAKWNESSAAKQFERALAIAEDQSKLNHLSCFPAVTRSLTEIPHPEGLGLLLAPESVVSLTEVLEKQPDLAGKAVTIVVGPEGGMSTNEIAEAKSKGYVAVSLGEVSYRSISAGAAALAELRVRSSAI